MRVRIVNEDGVGHNTKIFDADTGERIEGVVEIEPITVDDHIMVKLLVVPGFLNIVSDEVQLASYCPYCGAEIPVYPKNKGGLEENVS